jgi:tetratricopeptide (TPR) repeat protein
MRLFGPIILFTTSCGFAVAQPASNATYRLALPEHKGQLKWSADGFQIIQSSAKANGQEIGIRGRNGSGRLTFLGFLFLAPEGATLTRGKCRDGALDQEKKRRRGLKILNTSEIARPGGLPVSLVTFSTEASSGAAGYMVRGFVAAGDICGDLEFYSTKPISAEDPDLKAIFSTYELDDAYAPTFVDVVRYAQVLYETQMYKAAAPFFERALSMIPMDGAPYPSARIAKRALTDQAGMSYGIAGEFAKARTIFEKGIEEDPDYALYYYNLACTDAGERKLGDARLHLQKAFARKNNLIPGEAMPDPSKDDSFLPFKDDKDFWAFLERLQAGK